MRELLGLAFKASVFIVACCFLVPIIYIGVVGSLAGVLYIFGG